MSSNEYSQLQTLKEKELKSAIQEGMDDLSAGRILDGKEVMDGLRKRIHG
jgi:predicted transcriptional regulator